MQRCRTEELEPSFLGIEAYPRPDACLLLLLTLLCSALSCLPPLQSLDWQEPPLRTLT